MAEPTVRATVFMPVHDNADFIEAQIESLAAQWRPDLELLIIDDGSRDGSGTVAATALARFPQVRATLLRNETRTGMAVFMRMLEHASGEIIIEAHSDDLCLPGRLDAILERFSTDPTCRLVTSNAALISARGAPIGIHLATEADEVTGDLMRVAAADGSPQWLGATSAYDRSLLLDFPALDPQLLPHRLDLVLPMRAVLTGSHHYIARPLIAWRQHARDTHRLTGAYGRTAAEAEPDDALMAMAFAQRLRDLDHFVATSDVPTLVEPAYGVATRLFRRYFERWRRLHNGEADAALAAPEMATLRPGERLMFGEAGALGALAAGWEGVYSPEPGFNWTSRTAVLGFRLDGRSSRSLVLGLAPFPHGSQSVEISVNFAAPVVVADAAETFEVTLPTGPMPAFGCVTLTIHVPAAGRPIDHADSDDQRTLGVKLLWIEASVDGHGRAAPR